MFFKFLTSLKNGFKLTAVSFKFIRDHMKLIIFPVLKMIALISAAGLFFIGCFYSLVVFMSLIGIVNPNDTVIGKVVLGGTIITLLFLFIILFKTVNSYFNIAIITYVAALLNHENASIGYSLKNSSYRIVPIVQWTSLNTVASMLKNFFSGNRQSTSLLAESLYVIWSMGTLFVEPIIAEENLSLMDVLKKSVKLIKNAFGEVVGATTGFGMLKGIILTLGWGGLYLFSTLTEKIEHTSSHAIIITIVIAFVLFFLFQLISLADYIFRTAVYQYACRKNSGPFSEHLIKTSFVTK